jgi:hypothetical protein
MFEDTSGDEMVIDFDGWYGKQDADTQATMGMVLEGSSDPGRKKRQLAGIFTVSQVKGIDLPTVNDRWDTMRAGFAEEMSQQPGEDSGAWLAARGDDDVFHNMLLKRATAVRNEQKLVSGPTDVSEPALSWRARWMHPLFGRAMIPEVQAEIAGAQRIKNERLELWNNSLVKMSEEAAYRGEHYAPTLGKWQAANITNEGYNATHANQYVEKSKEAWTRMRDAKENAAPVAALMYIDMARERAGAGPTAEGGEVAPYERFRNLSPFEQNVALRLMTDQAGKAGIKKEQLDEFWKVRMQAFAESVGRGYENLAVGGATEIYRNGLLNTEFKAGDLVDAQSKSGPQEIHGRIVKQYAKGGSAAYALTAHLAKGPQRQLTAEEAAEWNKQLPDARKDLDAFDTLRKFSQNVIDPTRIGGEVFNKMVIPAADSIAIMSSLSIPAVSAAVMPMNIASYQNDAYMALVEQGVDPRTAHNAGQWTGLGQAGLDLLQVGVLKGFGSRYLPRVTTTLERFAMTGPTIARFGVNVVGTTLAETGIEEAQDILVPALVQDIMVSDPRFDVRWSKVWADAIKAFPETAMGMVLLAGMGGMHQTWEQSEATRAFVNNTGAMILRGYTDAQIVEIQSAPEAAQPALLAQYLPMTAPRGEAAKEHIERAFEAMDTRMRTLAEQLKIETDVSTEAAAYAVRLVRRDDGWHVIDDKGNDNLVDRVEAARVLRNDLVQAKTEEGAQAIISLLDSWHAETEATRAATRETTITGEQVGATEQGLVRQGVRGEEKLETLSDQAMSELHREAQQLAESTGNGEIFAMVNGRNEVEFKQKTAETAAKLVQRIELNRSESIALTALHETLEANYQAGLLNGTLTVDGAVAAVRSIAKTFDPARARTSEERAFREQVQKVAEGKANATEIRETLTELAVANEIGRRKDGTRFERGALSQAILDAIDLATEPEQVKGLNRIWAFLKAVKVHFRAVFSNVIALRKARAQGKVGQEFETIMAQMRGEKPEVTEHEQAVAEDVGAMAAAAEVSAAPGPTVSFSLSAVHSGVSKVSNEYDASRVGTATQGKVRPTTQETNVSMDTVTSEGLAKQMGKIDRYSNRSKALGGAAFPLPKYISEITDPVEKRDALLKLFVANLVALHDAFPAQYRERATHWYDGARKIADEIAKAHGISSEQAAAYLAVFSPMKDWFQNVAMGKQFAAVFANDRNTKIDLKEMAHAIDGIVTAAGKTSSARRRRLKELQMLDGKSIDDLWKAGTRPSQKLATWAVRVIAAHRFGYDHDIIAPEGHSLGIRRNKSTVNKKGEIKLGSKKKLVWQSAAFIKKAISLGYDGSLENISKQLGTKHKIRNFYNNIIAPNSPYGDSTQDTHAVNASALFPMGNSGWLVGLNFGNAGMGGGGNSGIYWLFHEATKRAAEEVSKRDGKTLQTRQMQSITWEAVRLLFPDAMKRKPEFVEKIAKLWENSTDAEQTRRQILAEPIGKPEWADIESGTGGGRIDTGGAGAAGEVSESGLRHGEGTERVEAGPRGVAGREAVAGRRGKAGDRRGGVGTRGVAEAFSLSPAKRLGLLQKQLDEAMQRAPEKRIEFQTEAARRLRNLARDWATTRRTWKADIIRPLVEKRTPEQLQKEQDFRQADAFRSELERLGLEQADAARSQMYRDAMASERFQEVFEALTEHGWHEEDAAKMATTVSKAEAATFVEKVKFAWTRAQQTAAQWRQEEEARIARDYNPKAAMLRDLRTLDTILSVFPPEVRAKVGGFIKLASLSTDEARFKELTARIEKLDKVVEEYLRGVYDEAMTKLLNRAVIEGKAGKTSKGKAGADIHALFATVKKATEWTPEQAQAHILALDAEIASGTLTPEQEAHKQQEIGLVQLVSDWKNADAERRASALENATRIYSYAYERYQILKAQQSLRRLDDRHRLINSAGNGSELARDKQVQKQNKLPAMWTNTALALSSFEQLLHYTFLRDSATAQRLADMERQASNQSIDEVIAMQERVDVLYAQLAGGDALAGSKLAWKLAQKTMQVGTGKNERLLSELEAITATLMWRQEDGRRHMEGEKDEDGKPVGSWHYDQAFIDEIEGKLSDETKAVRDFLANEYASEYGELNTVYRVLNGVDLPKNSNYAPITVEPLQAQAGQTIDPVTGTTMSAGSSTPGSLRTRGSAIAKPRFVDAMQTFIAHKKQMAHYKAYAPFTNEARAVLNHRDTTDAITAKMGQSTTDMVRGWLDFFAAGGTRDASAHLEVMKGLRAASGRAARVALVGRLSTLAVQSTQLLAAHVEMPTGSYIKRVGKLMAGQLDWTAALNSPYIQRRLKQMPPIVQAAVEGLRGLEPNRLRHEVRKIGLLISGTDALFTAGTYAILLDYHLTQAKEMGMTGAEAQKYARNLAERSTDRVAQPVRPGARSLLENTATNPALRVVWSFASESRKNLGLAVYALKQGTAAERTRTLLTVFVLNGLVANFIRAALRDAMTGDDDETDERIWSKWALLLSTVTDPLQGIPIFGTMLKQGVFKVAGEWVPEGDLFSGVGRAVETGVKVAKRIEEGDEWEWEQTIKDVDAILSAMGLFNENIAAAASLTHLAKDIFGAGKNVLGEEETTAQVIPQ